MDAAHVKDGDQHPSIHPTSPLHQATMAEQRRSGIPQGTSGIARRAPSPSRAAFPSSRTGSSGPLGGYRPPSANAGDDGSAAPRFGFAAASSSSGISKAGQGKRTHSSAGLRDPETPGSNGSASKRTLLTSTSATPSPRFPQPSASYDMSMLKAEHERRELLSKQAYEKLQAEFRANGREAERIKQEKLALLRQWEEANAERKEEKESFEEQRKFLNEQVNTLQQQNLDLRTNLEEARVERTQLAQSSHGEETKQSLRIAALEFELASAKANAEECTEAKEKVILAFDIREKEWEKERERLEQKGGEHQDAKKLTSELSELLSKIHRLEGETLGLQRENRILKTRSESVEALKEQKRSLEERLGLVEELRRKYAEAEARIQELEADMSKWNDQLSNVGDVVAFESTQASCADVDAAIPSLEAPSLLTVDTLPTYLSALRGAIAGLSVRSSTLEERARIARKLCNDAERSSEEEASRRRVVEEELSAEKTERLKEAKLAETARMEVESYRRLLDTFQEESRNQSTQYNAASAEHIQVLETRLRVVEAELLAVSSEAKELRKLKQSSERMTGQGSVAEKELHQSLEESHKQCIELERQCVELGALNDQLYLRVGRGEFDQTRERCLELKDNPVSQDRAIRASTLAGLQRENQALLGQVEELSMRVAAQGGDGGDGNDGNPNAAMVPVQTLENQRREYEKLEQAMRNRDKAFDRLKEAFGAKATEYVTAVKALFGYDMHVVSKGKVKLRSVYARTSKGTSLTFDSGEDSNAGQMKLVGEARQGIAVGNLQDYWLGSDRFSVPCFLAALQLELYEGTTRALRGTWEADDEQ